MTVLPSGKVLVAGGMQLDYTYLRVNMVVSSAELYDPETGAWTLTSPMLEPRTEHSAVLLESGKVMVVGGWRMNPDFSPAYLTSAELYDPETGTWTATGSTELSFTRGSRCGQSLAVRLHSGEVLLIGAGEMPDRAEVYDPRAGNWRKTGSLRTPRVSPSATLLHSGQVLVVGGMGKNGPLASAEVYDPAFGGWSVTGGLDYEVWCHTATLLPTGEVLVTGGSSQITPEPPGLLGMARLYDPASHEWRPTGSMRHGRSSHVSVLLPSGRVLAASGCTEGSDRTRTVPNFGAVYGEVYDRATEGWQPGPPMMRYIVLGMLGALLPDGDVLVAGGDVFLGHKWKYGWSLADAELFRERPRATGPGGVEGRHAIGGTVAGLAGAGLVLSTPDEPDLSVAPGQTEFRFANGARRGTSYDVAVEAQPAGESCTVARGSGTVGSADVRDIAVTCSRIVPGTFSATGRMAVGREYHTATLLPGGLVLVAGGWDDFAAWCTAELYDAATGRFVPTGSMTVERVGHTATLLPGGRVLMVGGTSGATAGGTLLASAELYDPATGTFTATGSMAEPRLLHTATLLPNGTVLVAGGGTDRAELYDPQTGTFTPAGSLTEARYGPSATLVPGGQVLVAGNGSADLYDPTGRVFRRLASGMAAARGGHTATPLPGGPVLLVGGEIHAVLPPSAEIVMGVQASSFEASAEVYEPGTGTFSGTGGMTVPREGHTATLLADQRVLVTGGYMGRVLASAEVHQPTAGTFSATGSMAVPRWNHTATLLPGGLVLVAGGTSGTRSTRSAELYHP